jgi:tyrosyl-tRNA synthetase
MTNEEIKLNSDKFLSQISLILSTDPDVFELHRNSTWYKEMNSLEFI